MDFTRMDVLSEGSVLLQQRLVRQHVARNTFYAD